MTRMGDVGNSRHANCFNSCSQDMVGSVCKIRPGKPVVGVARERRFAEGIFREEEICPEFVNGLEKQLGYAGGTQR